MVISVVVLASTSSLLLLMPSRAMRWRMKRSYSIDAIRRCLFARLIVSALKVEFLSQHENTQKMLVGERQSEFSDYWKPNMLETSAFWGVSADTITPFSIRNSESVATVASVDKWTSILLAKHGELLHQAWFNRCAIGSHSIHKRFQWNGIGSILIRSIEKKNLKSKSSINSK